MSREHSMSIKRGLMAPGIVRHLMGQAGTDKGLRTVYKIAGSDFHVFPCFDNRTSRGCSGHRQKFLQAGIVGLRNLGIRGLDLLCVGSEFIDFFVELNLRPGCFRTLDPADQLDDWFSEKKSKADDQCWPGDGADRAGCEIQLRIQIVRLRPNCRARNRVHDLIVH